MEIPDKRRMKKKIVYFLFSKQTQCTISKWDYRHQFNVNICERQWKQCAFGSWLNAFLWHNKVSSWQLSSKSFIILFLIFLIPMQRTSSSIFYIMLNVGERWLYFSSELWTYWSESILETNNNRKTKITK